MGFASVDALVNAATNGQMQRLAFSKTMPSTSAANIPHTLWKATGIPTAGTDTTNGKANGRALTKSTTGAYPHGNAASGTQHLITFGATSPTALGTIIVVDRMADCQLSHAEATGSITGLDASTRMASTTAPGDGGMLWCEVTNNAFSAASNTITFEATDQLGNANVALSGMVTTASAIVGRSVNSLLWQNLASGVTGIRALTKVTLTAGSATGNYNACIVRPLGTIPIPAASVYAERDFAVEIPNLPRLYDDTCLAFILIPTTALTATVFGELRICYN